MKQLGLVVVAVLVVVLVASCSCKAQLGNPKDLGTDEGKTGPRRLRPSRRRSK